MNRILAGTSEPLAWTIPKTTEMAGMSRSTLYRAAAAGEIKLLKRGRSTLVDVASVKAYLGRLPQLKPKVAA